MPSPANPPLPWDTAEGGFATPDVAAALAWRDWDTGLAEARGRRVPMLALAEAPWTNSAQRIGLVLGRDAALRAAIEETFVPVLLDPFARPDLVSRWRAASVAITGSSGPPLVMALTHEGRPFLSYCTMWPEGRAPHPSLMSLARATGEAYARDPEAFVAEARALDSSMGAGAAPAFDSAGAWWSGLGGQIDSVYGGLQETPKHPRPQVLWMFLDLDETGDAAEAGELVKTTLHSMLRGGINDQIGAGFHRCARDERWIVPHFEKPVPLNAQLAAVYARAARAFGDEVLLDAANSLSAFCLEALRQDVDAIASASMFYTWTAREVLGALSPSLVQPVSLHYNTTPDGSRQVLYRARNLETLAGYGQESPETLRRRLGEGRRQLRAARERRPAPAQIRVAALSWPATTIHWLARAVEFGCEEPGDELGTHLERLVRTGCNEDRGYVRPDPDGSVAWLEDQSAILGAALAVYRVTGKASWRERAQTLADVILHRYARDAGWLDRPKRDEPQERSLAIVDEGIPAAIATLTDAFSDLGALAGDDRYREKARVLAAVHLPGPESGAWAASLWGAWFRLA